MSFKPSFLASVPEYDNMGALVRSNRSVSDQNATGLAMPVDQYETDSERVDAVAPFLGRNIQKDRNRRNYLIAPDGTVSFHVRHQPSINDPDAPLYGESFGHDRQPRR